MSYADYGVVVLKIGELAIPLAAMSSSETFSSNSNKAMSSMHQTQFAAYVGEGSSVSASIAGSELAKYYVYLEMEKIG